MSNTPPTTSWSASCPFLSQLTDSLLKLHIFHLSFSFGHPYLQRTFTRHKEPPMLISRGNLIIPYAGTRRNTAIQKSALYSRSLMMRSAISLISSTMPMVRFLNLFRTSNVCLVVRLAPRYPVAMRIVHITVSLSMRVRFLWINRIISVSLNDLFLRAILYSLL